MTTEFSAKELFSAVQSGQRLEKFKQPDWTSDEPKYSFDKPVFVAKEGGITESLYRAVRDDKGFPVVANYETVEVHDESDLKVYDFYYEGGFVPGFGYFRMVDNGHLGDGHEAWALVEHESGRLFRFEGWYSSWDSGEWNECVEVEAAHVTVLRYKPKGGTDEQAFDNPAVTV